MITIWDGQNVSALTESLVNADDGCANALVDRLDDRDAAQCVLDNCQVERLEAKDSAEVQVAAGRPGDRGLIVSDLSGHAADPAACWPGGDIDPGREELIRQANPPY